jgi:hypothetical protein
LRADTFAPELLLVADASQHPLDSVLVVASEALAADTEVVLRDGTARILLQPGNERTLFAPLAVLGVGVRYLVDISPSISDLTGNVRSAQLPAISTVLVPGDRARYEFDDDRREDVGFSKGDARIVASEVSITGHSVQIEPQAPAGRVESRFTLKFRGSGSVVSMKVRFLGHPRYPTMSRFTGQVAGAWEHGTVQQLVLPAAPTLDPSTATSNYSWVSPVQSIDLEIGSPPAGSTFYLLDFLSFGEGAVLPPSAGLVIDDVHLR